MTTAKEVTFIGSTSVFLGDFGTIEAVPSRQLSNDKIFLIDPDFVSLCTLNGRNFLEEDLAKVGDATESHVLIEWSLKPLAPEPTLASSTSPAHNQNEGAAVSPLFL